MLACFKQQAYVEDYHGLPIVRKRIVNETTEGMIDPILFEKQKKQLKLVSFLPDNLLDVKINDKLLISAREGFNSITSVDCGSDEVIKSWFDIAVVNGSIRMYHYHHIESDNTYPTVYYIHGGAFFAGSHMVVEESLKMLCMKFKFNVFSVDYRLAIECPYPIGHQDCYAGFEWVIEHAKMLNINSKDIYVMGDSAGGNIAQYISTREYERNMNRVKGQLLLYPTINLGCIEDDYFHWSINEYDIANNQKKGLTKLLKLFSSMPKCVCDILKVDDLKDQYLTPYMRNPKDNPPTFLAVGAHDYLMVETRGYALKLFLANVKVKLVMYNGLGHAFFDSCGVYPQCEDVIDEMGEFILSLK